MPASGLPTRFTKSLAGDAQSAIMPAALPMTPSFPFRARGSLWLFGAVAFLYLFSTSRERPWGDATPIWEVADSIAHSHNFHAKTRWPTTLPNGKDGHLYGREGASRNTATFAVSRERRAGQALAIACRQDTVKIPASVGG